MANEQVQTEKTRESGTFAAQGQNRGLHVPSMLRPLLSRRSVPVSPLPGETEPYRGTRRHLVLSGFLLTVILSAIMALPLLPGQVDIEPGMPATTDIFSPTFLRYESKVLTEKARQSAVDDPANELWVLDTEAVQRQRSVLLNNLSVLDYVRSDETLGGEIQRQRLESLRDVQLTQAQIEELLNLSESDYRYWRNSGVLPAFEKIMRDRRITSEADIAAARRALPDLIVPSLGGEQKAAAVAFITPLITNNVRLDEEQTRQRRETAAASVKPVIQTVQKGEAILRQGELATPEAIEKMQEAGLLSRDLSLPGILSTTAMVALLMLLMHLYIYRYAEPVWRRHKQLLLVGLLIVSTVAVARIFLPGHAVLPYTLPLAAVSMLIAVLLHENLAVLVTFVLSVLVGMSVSSGLSMELPIYYFTGGLVGIFTLTRVERVGTFAQAGSAITVAGFAAALLMRTLSGGIIDWPAVQGLGIAALLSGVLSASLTYATFSLLGTLFGITTPVQLMELAHPDQPILRRLMREAPGTYHHSLVVSNLAERAAEMIGADALLTRVCAYYHDIGKVEHPYYFVDNQSGMRNIHDDLTPHVSSSIIARHVKDGVKLGQKYKLPRRVLDAIPQHHGTMLIKYFYHKALQDDPNVNEDDFRYPGPKPQTKENAILMLADGVEATVRAMAQSGALDKLAVADGDAGGPAPYSDDASLPEAAIARVVHQVISDRIEDGQLDECDLTVRDIARIQEAFVSMLKGIYHPRVAYPGPPKRGDAVQPQSGSATPAAGGNGHALPAPAQVAGAAGLANGNGITANGQGRHTTAPLAEAIPETEKDYGEGPRAASLS